ncbi:Transcriptional regulator VpsR [Vibrio cholerae]|nr:Transcriptional regulator VpsR [Vibrio cholerae]
MSTQFRMDSVPGSLVVVGGTYEPWLAVLEKVGWRCTQVADLRKADALFVETGPCIGIVDLSHDEFSLNGIANLVSSHKQVRWLAFIREAQLSSDTICQFIVNFCIDFFTAPIPDAQLLSTIGHQLGMLKLEKKVWLRRFTKHRRVRKNLSFQLIAELCQKSALKASCLVLAKRRKVNNPFCCKRMVAHCC